MKHYIVLDVFTHGSILNFDLTGYTFELNISGNTVTVCFSTGDGNDSNGGMAEWAANAADSERLNAGNILCHLRQ